MKWINLRTIPCCLFFFFLLDMPFVNAQTDRFVGLHFDFHAKNTDTTIGKTISEKLVDSFFSMVQPDFIQVDTKGNFGYSSYPTQVGEAAPAIKNDVMRVFVDAAKKNNVAVYAHYSALIDIFQARTHTEWARTNPNGTKDWFLSSQGAYVDKIMIPQLRELATKYNLNGAWVDGDSYAVKLDYSPSLVAEFKAKYGVNAVPKKGDANFTDWIEFNRSKYKEYFRHYVNEVHRSNPDFKIIDNWAFSSYMPEKVDVNVDFLSGDARGETPYQAAYESRCFAAEGKPWDLMTWSIIAKNNKSGYKSVQQMEQEAANTIAIGGGFETYWPQRRDGSLPQENFRSMANIIAFCKQRKEFCFNGEVIPQVGIFFSRNSWKDSLSEDFLYRSAGTTSMRDALNLVIDAQYSANVLMEHQLRQKLSSYPVLIVSGWNNLGGNVIQQLINYVRRGGNLFVMGGDAIQPFAPYCRIGILGSSKKNAVLKMSYNGATNSVVTNYQEITPRENIQTFGVGNEANSTRSFPLGVIRKVGNGNIALLALDIKNLYSNGHVDLLKDITRDIISKMLPTPIVSIKNAPLVEQVVTRKNNYLFVHLINMRGAETGYDKISAVPSFNVEINLTQQPNSITLQPGNKNLQFTYQDGRANVTIPGLDLYSILQIR